MRFLAVRQLRLIGQSVLYRQSSRARAGKQSACTDLKQEHLGFMLVADVPDDYLTTVPARLTNCAAFAKP